MALPCCQNHGAWETLIALEDEGEEFSVAEKSKARKDASCQHSRSNFRFWRLFRIRSVNFPRTPVCNCRIRICIRKKCLFLNLWIDMHQTRCRKIVTNLRYCNFWFFIVLDWINVDCYWTISSSVFYEMGCQFDRECQVEKWFYLCKFRTI